MTKAMDKLDKKLRSVRPTHYGRCKRCGKQHEGGRAIRFQTTLYNTTQKENGHGQKIQWSRARSVCRDCAAEAIETVMKFLGEEE